MRISPLVGLRKPVRRLNKLVLPAPFGPTRAWTRPASSRRSTPFTARNPANSLVTPRVSTANPSVRARIGLRIVRRVVKGGIDLTGRSAIVTGGASGIGRAIAMDFAEHGARVLVADLDERSGTQIASSIGGIFRRADVSKREDCRALVDAAAGELGGVDILVNNAGLQHVAPIEEFPEEKRSEEHTSELQSHSDLVCRLLLEKKKKHRA